MSFNFSNITDDLFIGTTPLVNDYDGLRELGIRLIINMRFTRRPYPDPHHTPMQLLWLRTMDSPFFPLSIAKLTRGAKTALETIRLGGKVYVHCAGGRHRGVAMGACILIAQGYDPEAAMKLIVERRSFADPNAYYIRPRIMMFARQWDEHNVMGQVA
jgi:protein-tyrosine phosphatase